jgi:hypothetical protein
LLLFGQWVAGEEEVRTWTSVKGDTIEAAYVRHAGAKVELKTADGRELTVPIGGLSDEDREYLAALVPPKIDIKVDVDIDLDTVDSDSSGMERKKETSICEVLVRKNNREPSNRTFTVYIYVFAKQTTRDAFWLISQTEGTLSFADGRNRMLFTCPAGVVEYMESSPTDRVGYRYEGYLVIIEDEDGNPFALESNREDMKKKWRLIKGAETLTQFNEYFYPIEKTRKSSF